MIEADLRSLIIRDIAQNMSICCSIFSQSIVMVMELWIY
jgi:hypothetical protein